jgi:Asp-tRNA(Asn)/Glu-tRNA(Gln) amidotransferase A subunit family amidase
VIKRIERVNPKINAVLTKLFGIEKAHERAKKGIGDGMFAGAPVMLKNLTQYKDARIDFGSRLYARFIAKAGAAMAQSNSPLIDAMERSGSQFAAWRGGEAMLLQLAYELEAERPWVKKRPPVFVA